MSVCLYVCLYVCMCVYACACVCVCVCVCYVYVFFFLCVYVSIWMDGCMYLYMHACGFIYICVCVCVHTKFHSNRDCENLERASSGLVKAIQLRMDSEKRVVKMAEFSRVVAESLAVAIGGSYSPAVAALVLEQQVTNITKCQVCECMYACVGVCM
jgi:hypothetical protein